MAQVNRQVGRELVTRLPPPFDGYEVVDNTWKPEDMLKDREVRGRSGKLINVSFYAPGDRVKCQMVQFVTVPPTEDLKKSNVISEALTDDNPTPGKWLVRECAPDSFGPTGLVFNVTLERDGNLDLTQEFALED